MKERGKAVEVSNGNNNSDYSYSSSLDLPCKKHPSSSSVGICAYCLKDRLIKLVCSDCGEQRLSSCSCSDFSSYRNSCSTVEVGSVGRISFLIENEKTDPTQFSKPKIEKSDEFIMLKRSSSSCTEVKRSNGFWRIGKFFRKKRGKQGNGCEKSVDGFDEKSDMWVSEYMGVSRSRSLCSFRGNLFNDPDREGSEFAFSSAKISDVNEAEPRRSGFSRGLLDAENGGDLNELNSGASVVPKKCGFPVKESDLKGMDESGFIDLKLDLSSEPKTEYSALKMIDLPTSVSEHCECGGNLKENRLFGHGGLCRITVNEKRIKKGSKGRKVWRWIFSHHHHGWTSTSSIRMIITRRKRVIMYVTRPLSHYINSPESLSLPAEGPNSGYLVIQDEEAELYCCFGLCKERDLIDLPFPQNKNLTTRYTSGSGEHKHTSDHDVVFIPVLNQPLSCNRYYAIEPHGSHIGEAYACSTEEDMATCCFCRCIQDAKPRQLDPHNTYQQFEIALHETMCNEKGKFYANSVARDSFPPNFLRRKGWQVQTKTPKNYELGEAAGLNTALRARLPDFNIPVSYKSSNPVNVGKWYCPFVFVKDGTLRNQVKNSMFYEMTLEQRWEQIFECDNDYSKGNAVMIDVVVKNEVVLVAGREAVWDEKNVVDRAIWYKSFGSGGEEVRVGLSLEIVERLKWEEARVGWVGGEERQVRVNRAEEFGDGWRKFGCYILVERFVLKRMDGSLVMAYDFKHTRQLKSIWE